MGELTIKVDDAELLKALEEMASAHGKPVDEEVRAVLERAAKDHARRMDMVRRADEIAAMTPKGVKQTDSVEIIREMREEHDQTKQKAPSSCGKIEIGEYRGQWYR